MTTPSWYERRNELEMGTIFRRADGSIVMLESYVPGDGTLMYVANRISGSWCHYDSTAEPSDLVGEPMTESDLKALGI